MGGTLHSIRRVLGIWYVLFHPWNSSEGSGSKQAVRWEMCFHCLHMSHERVLMNRELTVASRKGKGSVQPLVQMRNDSHKAMDFIHFD